MVSGSARHARVPIAARYPRRARSGGEGLRQTRGQGWGGGKPCAAMAAASPRDARISAKVAASDLWRVRPISPAAKRQNEGEAL